MWTWLFLLLPVAAASGWYLGNRQRQQDARSHHQIPEHYFQGLNYLINEQPDKAVEVFLHMLDLDDQLVDVHLSVGSLFRRRGEVDRAIRIHQGLIARPALSRSQRALALLNLAKDYIAAGVLDRAEHLLLELVALKEQEEISLRHLLSIYQEGKEWEKAIKTAKQLALISGENLHQSIAHYYCERAEIAIQQGCDQQAKEELKTALHIDRQCVRANILQGDLACSMGEYAQALRDYQKVAKQNSVFLSEVLEPMAHCYTALEQSEMMQSTLKQYLFDPKTTYFILSQPKWLFALHSESGVSFEQMVKLLEQQPSLRGFKGLFQIYLKDIADKVNSELQTLHHLMINMTQSRPKYRCEQCGFSTQQLKWLCPGCKSWNTIYLWNSMKE